MMLLAIEQGLDWTSPQQVLWSEMKKDNVDGVRFILEGAYTQADAPLVIHASLQRRERVVEYIMSSPFADPFRHTLEFRAGVLLPIDGTEEDFHSFMGCAIGVGNYDAARLIYEERGILPYSFVSNEATTDDEALEIYEWMYGVGVTKIDACCLPTAAINHWPKVVEWLCILGAERYCVLSLEQAAQNESLPTLQLIHEWELQPLNESVMMYAVTGGHIDVVKWLTTVMVYDDMWTYALAYAVAFDHLEMAVWLRDNGQDVCPACTIKVAVSIALHPFHYACCDGLRWLYEQMGPRSNGDCVGPIDEYTDDVRNLSIENAIASFAGTAGDLALLEWLLQHVAILSVDWGRVAENAATHGHLGVIQWIHELKDVALDMERIKIAAAKGCRVADSNDYDDRACGRGVVLTQHVTDWTEAVESNA